MKSRSKRSRAASGVWPAEPGPEMISGLVVLAGGVVMGSAGTPGRRRAVVCRRVGRLRRWTRGAREGSLEGALEIHGSQPGGPVLNIGQVWLRRFPRRRKRGSAVLRHELDPTFPRPIVSRATAGTRPIDPVFIDEE